MISLHTWLIAACVSLFPSPAAIPGATVNNNIAGTWMGKTGDTTHLLLLYDEYLTLTSYDVKNKRFYYTKGGAYSFNNKMLVLECEFNSADKTQVEKDLQIKCEREGNKITIGQGNKPLMLQYTDSSATPLSGCWRINGRMQNGKMSEMTLKARRTLKILTGTHFQWMAINTATGEFFGSGGGRYEFKNGKYIEYIEFFSRDSTRIGMSLSFEGEVKNDLWHHSGVSSKGDPIQETWTKYRP